MAMSTFKTPDRTVVLCMHTTEAPSQMEWDEWCSLLGRHAEAAKWDLTQVPNLVVTDGGAPSTMQRSTINNMLAQGKGSPRVAVVTSSMAVRTIARAFTIFNPMFKVFAPAQMATALSFMGVASWQRGILTMLQEMEAEQLGPGSVKTLQALG